MQAPRRLQLRRGNTAAVSTYVGAPGELVVNTDTNTLYLHDGVTVGGTATTVNVSSINGNISSLQSNVTILFANAAAQANALLTLQAGAYSNVNVAAYLTTGNYATQTYVSTAISNLIDGAPGLLDTLNEIAAAINDDANVFATLSNTISNANVAMKGYVDSQVSTLTANAAAQANTLLTLQAGAYSNVNVRAYLTSFDGNILPSANVTYSLGSATRQWKDLFVSNNTIYIGGIPLSIDAGGNLLVNGNTVQAGAGGNVANLWNSGYTVSLNSVGNVTFPTGSQITNGYPGPDGSVGDGSSWFVTPSSQTGGIASADGQQYIQINNGSSVLIGTGWPATAHEWAFNSTGNLILPAGGYILNSDNTVYGGGIIGSNIGNLWVSNSGTDLWLRSVYNNNIYISPDDINALFVPKVSENLTTSLTGYSTNGLGLFTANAYISMDDASNFSSGNIALLTSFNNNNYKWKFDGDGKLTAPGEVYGQYFTVRGGGSPGDEIGSLGYGGNIVELYGTNGVRISTVGEGGPLWQFDTSGNLTLPHNSRITEVPSPVSGNYALSLSGTGAVSPDQQLLIYPTSVDANHLHLTTGNLYNTELFFGNDDLYVKLSNVGDVVVNTNDNQGNTAQWTFDSTGNLILPQVDMFASPTPTSWPGITFSDGTFQNTATIGGAGGGGNYSNANVASYLLDNPQTGTFSNTNVAAYLTAGSIATFSNTNVASYIATQSLNAATVDITNTNGLGTTYYPTFVESRTTGQYVRADVDLTYRTDTNTLTTANITATANVSAGGLTVTGPTTLGGNVVVQGNMQVLGTLTTVNATGLNISNLVITVANSAVNSSQANGAGILVSGANSSILYNSVSNSWVFSHPLVTTGNVTAAYFIGNGSQLTGMNTFSNTNVTAYLSTGTVVIGTLASPLIGNSGAVLFGTTANVLGAITVGRVNSPFIGNTAAVLFGTTANVFGVTTTGTLNSPFIGNTGAVLFGTTANIAGTATVGNLQAVAIGNVSTALTGVIQTPSQTNITTVGTLASVTVTGNATVGNLVGTESNTRIISNSYVTTFDIYGNVTMPGNVIATRFIGDGSLLTGIAGGSGNYSNTNVAAYLTTASIATFSNTNVANYLASQSIVSYGNAQVATYLPSYTGNLTAGNIVATGNVTANYLIGNISVFGNVVGTSPNVTIQAGTFNSVFDNQGNVVLPNLAVTGNVIANKFIGDGSLLTGISGGSGTYSNANVASYLLNGTSSNIVANSGAYFVGNGAFLTGITASGSTYSNTNVIAYLSTASISTYSNTNVANYLTTATITTTGNVTAGNIVSNGNITAGNANISSNLTVGSYLITSGSGGNISGVGILFANVVQTTGNIISNANIVTNSYFVGNGSQLTGLPATYSNTTAQAFLSTGVTSIVATSGIISGNITSPIIGNASSVLSGASEILTAGLISGNVRSPSIGNASAVLSGASMNLTGGIITGNVNSPAIGNSSATLTGGTLNVTGTATVGNIQAVAIGNVSTTLTGVLQTPAQTNITSVGTLASLAVTATITAGNLSASTGNVTANNFVGIGANTSIIAGAFTSTFDTTGNVILPNLAVTGNVTVSGTSGVIMPNRPAFRINGNSVSVVQTTSDVNLKTPTANIAFNQGGYYNNTTGIFTAPVAGIYSVGLNARVANFNGLNQIAVLKNGLSSTGNVVCWWETDTNVGTATHFGVNGTVILAVGEWLSANILAGNITFDQNDNWHVTYLG